MKGGGDLVTLILDPKLVRLFSKIPTLKKPPLLRTLIELISEPYDTVDGSSTFILLAWLSQTQTPMEDLDIFLKYFAKSEYLLQLCQLLLVASNQKKDFNMSFTVLSKVFALISLEAEENRSRQSDDALLGLIELSCFSLESQRNDANDLTNFINIHRKMIQTISLKDPMKGAVYFLVSFSLPSLRKDKRLLEDFMTESLYLYESIPGGKTIETQLHYIYCLCTALKKDSLDALGNSRTSFELLITQRLLQYCNALLKKKHKVTTGILILSSLPTKFSKEIVHSYLLLNGLLAEVWNWWDDLLQDSKEFLSLKIELLLKLKLSLNFIQRAQFDVDTFVQVEFEPKVTKYWVEWEQLQFLSIEDLQFYQEKWTKLSSKNEKNTVKLVKVFPAVHVTAPIDSNAAHLLAKLNIADNSSPREAPQEKISHENLLLNMVASEVEKDALFASPF